jgi:hypothetical protein
MTEHANLVRTRNLDTLNQDQKAKLKVLDDALKLAPIIMEAQSGNLIGASLAPYAYTSNIASTIGAILSPV